MFSSILRSKLRCLQGWKGIHFPQGEKKHEMIMTCVPMKHVKFNKIIFREKKRILEMNNFILPAPIIRYNYRWLLSSRWRSSAQTPVQQKKCWSWKYTHKFSWFFFKILWQSHILHTQHFDCFHHNHFWGQSSLHYLRLTLAKQDESVAPQWVFPSPLSPRLFWDKQHERAKHSAVCSNKTVLSFCCTLAQVILQLLQL